MFIEKEKALQTVHSPSLKNEFEKQGTSQVDDKSTFKFNTDVDLSIDVIALKSVDERQVIFQDLLTYGETFLNISNVFVSQFNLLHRQWQCCC